MNGYLSDLDDPENMKNNAKDYINFKVMAAQDKYGDDPTIKAQAIANAKRDLIKGQIEQLRVNEPLKAKALADQNRALLGDQYAPVTDALIARANDQQAQVIGNAALTKAAIANVPGQISPDQLHDAFEGQESGHRQYGPNGQVLTSPTGAMGIRQIEPGTWAQWAQPGERIDNAADNRAVSNRILDSYYAQYGGDVSRVAVAYYSGPRNVSPAGSPNPWIQDYSMSKATPGNPSRPIPPVSTYVSNIVGRLGATKADATRFVMEDNPGVSDDVQQKAMQFVRQRIYDDQIAQNATATAAKAQQEQIQGSFAGKWMQGQAPTQQDIRDIGAAVSQGMITTEQGQSLMKMAMADYGLDQRMKFGPGFDDVLKRMVLPANDPNQIGGIGDIIKLGTPGDDGSAPQLTTGGMDQAIKLYGDLSKNPDAAFDYKVMGNLGAHAKNTMGKLQDMGAGPVQTNLKGLDLYESTLMPRLLKEYKDWKANGEKGENPLTLEHVDKMIEEVYPKAERDKDNLVGGTVAGSEPVPPVPAGLNPANWNSVMTDRPTVNGSPYPMAAWQTAIDTLQKNPTERTIGLFDKKFGPAYSGAEILGKLSSGSSQPTGLPGVNVVTPAAEWTARQPVASPEDQSQHSSFGTARTANNQP